MHHSQSDSKPSLQKGGKPASGPVGASILASVDGKAGRYRATVKQSSASQSQRRVWVWALPLVLGAVAAGGLVWWLQQPAEQVASAPLAADLSADRSVDQVAFVADGNVVNASAHTDPAPEQTFTPDSSREQGAHIEDTGTLTAGVSPFTALQAKADASVEPPSPFQALNGATPAERGAVVPPTQPVPRSAQTHANDEGTVPHQIPKSARSPAVAVTARHAPASAAVPALSTRGNTVVARAESAPQHVGAHGGGASLTSASAAMSASVPVRASAESPAATGAVSAIKPAVTTIAASAAQAAASAAVAEVPTALGSRDPVNSLLKAAGHAAAAVTAQGVSRLTRADTQQPTAPAAGQPGTAVAPAQSAAADARKSTAVDKGAAESSSAGSQADDGQAESTRVPGRKPNNKPEKPKAPDPDVTLMRALMRHLETPSK